MAVGLWTWSLELNDLWTWALELHGLCDVLVNELVCKLFAALTVQLRL